MSFKLNTFENGGIRTHKNSIASTFPCQMDLHRDWAVKAHVANNNFPFTSDKVCDTIP